MKYFRAFRLVGTEAMDEYYHMASELAVYQNAEIQKKKENPQADIADLQLKINDLHMKMYEKYGMIPYLHYHAMPEKGFVSELLNEESYKKLLNSGEVKEGQARKLELVKDEKKETGYSVPVFKIDNPESIQEFNNLLKKWQDLKLQLKEAVSATRKQSLEEQYEAFKLELKEKYRMNPESQFVFETTEIGVYMGCSEAHLSQIAEWQKQQRADSIADQGKSS